MRRIHKLASLALVIMLTSGCVTFPPPPAITGEAEFENDVLVSVDGAHLGFDVWRAETPRAVIIAVHGMNDYANAFSMAGKWWAENADITTYAYDQRGFGRSPGFGRWPGEGAMKADLRAAVAAAHEKHPDIPVFVLGHSMGAAVVMVTAAEAPLDADGLILASPGVWGGRQMSPFYRFTLNLAARVTPGKTLTGKRTHRQSTDNIPVLRAMLDDPHVIKPTRMDAILGVVRLMGEAYEDAENVSGDILFIYGQRDEIIPLEAMQATQRRIKGEVDARAYPDGWHLLFRDLKAEVVWRDVADWVRVRKAGSKNAAG